MVFTSIHYSKYGPAHRLSDHTPATKRKFSFIFSKSDIGHLYNKKNVLKYFLPITLLFFFVPIHQNIQYHFINIFRFFFGTAAIFFIQLAFVNSVINPFIYAFTNPSFRNGLRQLLLCRRTEDTSKSVSGTGTKMTSAADKTFTLSMENDTNLEK